MKEIMFNHHKHKPVRLRKRAIDFGPMLGQQAASRQLVHFLHIYSLQ